MNENEASFISYSKGKELGVKPCVNRQEIQMKNQEVVSQFVNWNEAKTKHLFSEGNVLYSYGYHFPLCIRLFGGFIVNSDSYSHTTATHKGLIKRELDGNFIEMNTEQLNQIIQNNINTIKGAKELLILKAI